MNNHLKMHTDGKFHTCNVCDKSLTVIEDFNLHLRIHSSGKAFLCDKRERNFYFKSNLNANLERHNEQNPYVFHYYNKKIHKCS